VSESQVMGHLLKGFSSVGQYQLLNISVGIGNGHLKKIIHIHLLFGIGILKNKIKIHNLPSIGNGSLIKLSC